MDLFLKGLVHGFGLKIELFLICLFHRNSIRKHRFWYCAKKRMILSGKIQLLKRAMKRKFSKGVSPWLCPILIISIIAVFHWNYVTKDRFSIFMKEKKDFEWKKLKYYEGSKNGNFLKGLKHGVLLKNRTFSYRRFSQKFYLKTSFSILWKEKNDFKWKKLKF